MIYDDRRRCFMFLNRKHTKRIPDSQGKSACIGITAFIKGCQNAFHQSTFLFLIYAFNRSFITAASRFERI